MTEILEAEVIAVDNVHVVIICPICGEFHWHGSNGILTDQSYGTRVPHCHEERELSVEYELITNDRTIRKESILKKDLTPWRGEQKARRAAILRERAEKKQIETNSKILEAVGVMHAKGMKLERWRIAIHADVKVSDVSKWMKSNGIIYSQGRYQASTLANPEIRTIFGD